MALQRDEQSRNFKLGNILLRIDIQDHQAILSDCLTTQSIALQRFFPSVLSIAKIKTMTKSSVGERSVYLAYISKPQPIVEGNQSRAEPQRSSACWLGPHDTLSLLSYTAQNHLPGPGTLPTVGWTLPLQGPQT